MRLFGAVDHRIGIAQMLLQVNGHGNGRPVIGVAMPQVDRRRDVIQLCSSGLDVEVYVTLIAASAMFETRALNICQPGLGVGLMQ